MLKYFPICFTFYKNILRAPDKLYYSSLTSVWERHAVGSGCGSSKQHSLFSRCKRSIPVAAASAYLPEFIFLSPSQQSAEDLARVPANSTSNILNRLLVSYDPRIRPNFKGLFPPPPKSSFFN